MKRTFAALLCMLCLAAVGQTNYAPSITSWPAVAGLQHLEEGAGMDGEPALVYERADASEYKFHATAVTKNLQAGKRYFVGVYVKTEGMPKTHGGATCAIEYSTAAKKYAGGVWPEGVTNAKDWTKVEDTFTMPDEPVTSITMLLYMRKGAKGKAYFSKPYIYEAPPMISLDIISPVCKYAMQPGRTDLEFGVFVEGLAKKENIPFGMTIVKDGKTYAEGKAVLNGSRLLFTGFDFVPGDYQATVVDAEHLCPAVTVDFRVLPAGAKPTAGNHVTVDAAGRLIVNGKPFMPIGMYVNGTDKVEDFAIWKQAGFNCMMPYNTIWWKRGGTEPKTAQEHIEQVLKALDDVAAQDVKILFSVKDVHPGAWEKYHEMNDHVKITEFLLKSVKHHPTVIGWYLDDESEKVDFYKDFRRRISAVDPFHPTFQVQCRARSMARTVGFSDVFMVDPYPFYKEEDGSASCRRFMEVATDVFGKAVMAVPQYFPWYQYQKSPKDTYFPTLGQMRGHTLLEAAMGAKGFISYTFMSARRHLAKTGVDRWPDILALTQMLHDLEPFIMSLEKAPQATVEAKEGKVVATAFQANGKVVALVSGIEGKTVAEVVVPGQANLKSRYGLTKNLGNGRYLYEANGCNGDILE